MTDERRTSSTYSRTQYTKYTPGDGDSQKMAAPTAAPLAAPTAAPLAAPTAAPLAAPTAAPSPRRRHSVAGGRIAAAGIGIAAMLGLVANMEVTDGNAKAVTPAKASSSSAQRTAKGAGQGTAAAPGKVAAVKVKRPIVLTPHAVVHTVSAPSSGGSGGGSAYTAPAPAAAPVASSGGS